MPSAAAIKYRTLASRASVILKTDRRILDRKEVQAVYGAAFVTQAAAWNAYVVGIVECFFIEAADPAVITYHSMHTLASEAAKNRLERFNTPNSENTRNLILGSTGYDPWPDWDWPTHSMNGLAVRERLNEIFKVRHSLAHGFSMPGYVWTQTASGETRLTLKEVDFTRAFFKHLVAVTDTGMRKHLNTIYHLNLVW